MKKNFLLLLPLFALAGCTLETDSSGDLGGYWHLESADTLATGGHTDMSGHRIFWAVQDKLLEACDRDNGTAIFFRYAHTADSLKLSEPRFDNRTTGDPSLTDATLLRPLGIQQLQEGFAVEHLSGSTMILRSPTLRLGFRKF